MERMFLDGVAGFTRTRAEILLLGMTQKCPALQPAGISPQMTQTSSSQLSGCRGSFEKSGAKGTQPCFNG